VSSIESPNGGVVREANDSGIGEAAKALKSGQLVSFPTETVYGLGADATNDLAVAEIFAAKGRPEFNPLIVHIGDLDQAQGLGIFPENALKLAQAFWPGPLTLVVPRQPDCAASMLVSAGLDTIALRAPAHKVAQKLIAKAHCPIAAPSANRSGQVSPTEAQHVARGLGNKVAMILDAGPCSVGIESTIVGFREDEIHLLRPGGITREALEEVVGPLAKPGTDPGRPSSPGQLAHHYAPKAHVRLNAKDVSGDEVLLAFGPNVPSGAREVLNLSETGNLTEAAANLFAFLRRLDDTGCSFIAVMPIPQKGLGEAINDRLKRAAAPRPKDSQ
jgi:L-threonylcarbamoyladenylate synthase